jgi:DNA polymerase (family 10)
LPLESKWENQEELFAGLGLSVIPNELRENGNWIEKAANSTLPILIEEQDICGILHNHSTYSDGLHSLSEMAMYVKSCGYQYFGICDHSKSAFYANGLQPQRVLEQIKEINALNKKLVPFKIFKGIESDILSDGSLDYNVEILSKFDFVVASIHSNLRMDKDKATNRLISAIENPYTCILGHPTGRLLLSREGYPIDHKKIIDACAANSVSIELNANPLRLDLDYTWIPYALEKQVMIAINPDAHSKGGIHHVRYGVYAARKGGLTKDMCLNSKNLEEFEAWIGDMSKKSKQ